MPAAQNNHDAHDYAERIRDRLPRCLQELRERCGLSKYGLARESSIRLEGVGRIHGGFICLTRWQIADLPAQQARCSPGVLPVYLRKT